MNFCSYDDNTFTFGRLGAVKTSNNALRFQMVPLLVVVTLVSIFRVSRHRHGRCQRHALRYVKRLKREIAEAENPGNQSN